MNTGNAISAVLALFLFLISCRLSAQEMSGFVYSSEDNTPIAGAFVVAVSHSEQIAFTFSDQNGSFLLKIPEDGRQPDSITVSMLGFKTSTFRDLSEPTQLRFILKPQALKLNAAVSRSNMVENRGDTLIFYAGALKDGTEKNAADLLAKIPDIRISSTGAITHKGLPLNKFYVEGLDMMGGRYGVITQNLDPGSIESIEIYQNHQPVNVLKGTLFTDRSAINIVLKENLRNTWLFSGDIALGAPHFPLFEIRLMLSRFSKTSQSLFLGKGNNLGQDILPEIQDHMLMGKTGAFTISTTEFDADFHSPLSPGVQLLEFPKMYWVDNLSGIVSANHLFKTGKEGHVRFSLNAAGERLESEDELKEEIRFQDNTIRVFHENNSRNDRKILFDGNISYEKNAENIFINNIFEVAGQLRNAESLITGSTEAGENISLPAFKVSDRLEVTSRRNDNNTISFRSTTKYISRRHEGAFSVDETKSLQKYGANDFHSDNDIRWMTRIIGIQVHSSASIAIRHLNLALNSDLLSITSVEPGLGLSTSFYMGPLRIQGRIPASIRFVSGNGKQYWKPAIAPALFLNLPINNRWIISANAQYQSSPSPDESLYDSLIQRTYRTFSPAENPSVRQSFLAGVIVRYSSIPHLVFCSISGDYSSIKNSYTPSNLYVGNQNIINYIPIPLVTSGYSFSGSIQKFFGARTLMTKAMVKYGQNNFSEYIQNNPAQFTNAAWEISLNIDSKLLRWLTLRADANFRIGRLTGDISALTRHADWGLKIQLSPVKPLNINLDGYTRWDWVSDVSYSNPPLLTSSISWQFEKFTLTAECRNLLGFTSYERASQNDFLSYVYHTTLRGRQFLAGLRMRF